MTLKQLRLIRCCLAAGLVAIGGYAALDSFSEAVERLDPSLAARIATNPGEALAGRADQALVAALGTGQASAGSRNDLALAALRAEPLLPNALRDLGFTRSLAGDRDGARALMLAAIGQSRRDQFALVWLIDDAARRHRIGEALRWFDLALRTKEEVRQLLFPRLMAALADPDIRSEFVQYARRNPKWLARFYAATIEQPGGAKIVAETMLSTQGLPPDSTYRGIEQVLLERLVIQGEQPLARRVYAVVRGNRPALLTSAAITGDSVDPRHGGMAWQLGDDTAISGGFMQINGNPAISAVVYPGHRGLIASKLLYLQPGRYRLRVILARDFPATASLGAELGCAGTEHLLLKTDPAPSGGDWNLAIPPECPSQTVRLTAIGADEGQAGELTVTTVSIAKVEH